METKDTTSHLLLEHLKSGSIRWICDELFWWTHSLVEWIFINFHNRGNRRNYSGHQRSKGSRTNEDQLWFDKIEHRTARTTDTKIIEHFIRCWSSATGMETQFYCTNPQKGQPEGHRKFQRHSATVSNRTTHATANSTITARFYKR